MVILKRMKIKYCIHVIRNGNCINEQNKMTNVFDIILRICFIFIFLLYLASTKMLTAKIRV